MSDFTASFVVDQTPKEVFAAINNIRGWWGEDVQGHSVKVGDELTYRLRDIHNVCSNVWGSLLHNSLPKLIATGTGQPYS